MPEWTVDDQEKFTFDDAQITDLRVRIVEGQVNVVPTDGPARLEISQVTGPPLIVTRDGDRLTVAYEDLSWKSLMVWLDQRSWRRHAVVTVAVPRPARAQVGVVSGDAMVTGLQGRTSANAVSGTLTLAYLSGPVESHTVSGRITAQSLSGGLQANSVSGEITVVSTAGKVKAHSVSGPVTLDVAGGAPGGDPSRIELSSVSGEIAVRLPDPGDARVEASSTGGDVVTGFDELTLRSGFGPKQLQGRLGNGSGLLRANSVSGSITLLKRPPGAEDEPHERPVPAPGGPDDQDQEGKVL